MKGHEWFTNTDLFAGFEKQIETPFILKGKVPRDTSHFNDYKDEASRILSMEKDAKEFGEFQRVYRSQG